MHRSAIRVIATACALTGSVSVAATAVAEEPAPAIRYEFEDDDLLGDTMVGHVPIIGLHPKPQRVQLLRPRTSFVTEMLKTVEAL